MYTTELFTIVDHMLINVESNARLRRYFYIHLFHNTHQEIERSALSN